VRGRGKSDDDAKTQIWLLDATGGEPWAITDGSRSISHLEWAGNDALVFVAQEDAGRRESALKDDRKDSTHVVEDEPNEPPARLFRVEVESKKVRRLTANRDRIEQLAVSPDGASAVTGHARSLRHLYDNKIKPIFFLHDLKAGTSARVLEDATLNVSHLEWAADGKGFYATDERSRKPELSQAGVTELLFHDPATKKTTRLDLGWPRGLASQNDNGGAAGVVPVKGGFLALLADGIRYRPARFAYKDGKLTRSWIVGEHAANVFGMAASEDGKRVAYCHSTASSPPRWFHARLDADRMTEPVPFAPINTALATKRKARSEVVRWKGARGDVVDGLLFYPHGWTPGKPAPLVVQIHGGPASADHDDWSESWAYSANLVCQRGAFVLRPNYHGSTGYGLDWLESIADGRYCDLEADDIEKGVDALIARGLVDPKRLALTGWSNGAILTNVLIARTTRYRAAVAGAGSVEYVSDWSSCEFGEAFDRYYLGKSPFEDLALYVRKSPFYRLDKVRTPTLIMFGTEDRVVHPQQGWAMYRGLQHLGKAPVRFVQFPDEKHSIKKPSHRKRKLEEEMAWLDRHLFETTPKEEPKLVKKDSPLAWLIAKQKASRTGKLYGVMEKGVLVPETVPHGKLVLGRFEVTRAQYARSDANYAIEPGTENYPANGISFEQAKAYCAWLSEKTGRRYRLPTEADDLYEKPEDGDNTLDHWAGYAVNPDDAAKLLDEIAKLRGLAPLLREVGSGRAKGEVFDLGGNVAEWVEGKDGKGQMRGGSADAPADTRGETATAGAAYRGLRVVRE
jgi:dipeptidyl aminopeptidase/acylaminoacyl peptidase